MFRHALQVCGVYLGPLNCLGSFPQLRDSTVADNCALSMSGRPNQSHYQALAFFATVPRAPIKMGITATFVALYQAHLICYMMMMMMIIIIIILSLNREFFRAKDCVTKAFRIDCRRSQSINFNERNELLFKLSQWNPFCHNHRDPETVGQSLCYGEKDNSEKFRDINNTLIQTAKALSNLGNCTFMEYFCDIMKCRTAFYRVLHRTSWDCR